MRGVLCLLVAAACGRSGFTPVDDAVTGGDGTSGTGPWGGVAELSVLNIGAVNDDPSLTGDELEIYFNSNAAGNEDIWRATRASRTDLWSAPQMVAELSDTDADDLTPEVSLDGLTMYFSSLRQSTEGDIFRSTRPTRTSAWASPVAVTELNTSDADVAAVTVDEVELFMGHGSATDNTILRATRASTSDPWSTPVQVGELAAAGFDGDPYLSADRRTLYWTSQRTTTDMELWQAERAAPGAQLTNLQRVEGVSTTMQEDDAWVSPDGHTLYFARGTSFTTNMKIYMATR